MCMREEVHKQRFCINRIWEVGMSHWQHWCWASFWWKYWCVATVGPPFTAETGLRERESHNPWRTEAGFRPNSSSIPPSNDMRSHSPLDPQRGRKERVSQKQQARPPRERPSQETKEETDEMKEEEERGKINDGLCSFSDGWRTFLVSM